MCPRGFVSSVSAGRAMAAGPAGPFIRRPLWSVRLPRASPVPVFSLTSWSPNTAITFRFTGRARSLPGTASRSTARPWRTGLAAPAGGWSRCKPSSPSTYSPRRSCSPTTPRSRRPIPAAAAPKTGRLWVYARYDRPWSGPEPPAAVYFYSPDRKAERPAAHLQDFRGVLQVDGYAGFERLTAPGDIVLAACWAHARRKFYDLHEATGSPIAAEALRRIAELYAIERSIQGGTADARRHVRNTSARPLIEMMKPWLETELGRVPPAGPLAEAIRYALARWPALTRFLDDGRIELDNNPVERAIRPIALGRKNHLFAGSDGGAARWAVVASLLATAKLNDVEPFAYLKDVLEHMSKGHPMSRLDDLLPCNWTPSIAVAA